MNLLWNCAYNVFFMHRFSSFVIPFYLQFVGSHGNIFTICMVIDSIMSLVALAFYWNHLHLRLVLIIHWTPLAQFFLLKKEEGGKKINFRAFLFSHCAFNSLFIKPLMCPPLILWPSFCHTNPDNMWVFTEDAFPPF